MRKLILFLFCLSVLQGVCQTTPLRFREDGTFKIVQFTDSHICPKKSESKVAVQIIEETIDKEQPDLVVFTGDVVTGKPARKGWKMALEPVVKRGVPFCVMMGNHDAEQDLTRQEIADIVLSYPGTLNTKEAKGLSDVVLEIESASSDKPAALIYCMDSNDYSTIDTVKGYGWFTFGQIDWYRKVSADYKLKNGGKPLPALAFFHIALPEHKQAYDNPNNNPVGIRMEDECGPELNTGMFAAMLQAGDIMGAFVGHDHDNDYMASLYGIALGYGRFSGGKTTYIDIPPGARIFKLKEGERGFETFIRLADGKEISQAKYPGAFR